MLLSMRIFLSSLLAATLLGTTASAQVAQFPFFDSFEDPALGTMWKMGTESNVDSVLNVSDQYTAYDGLQQLELTTNATDGLQSTSVDLTIDLQGQKGVRVNFAHRRTSGGSFNNSGVYISDDGANFVFVLQLETFDTGEEYADYSLDLDKLAAENGLTFNDHFAIRFLWSGWASPSAFSGAAYDDVRIVPTNFSQLAVFNSTSPTGLGNFGAAMTSVADLNGDGIRDLAVGHPGYSLKRGRVELYSGATGKYLWGWSKGIFGEHYGQSLANLGDHDGDGFDELLIGAPSNDIGFADAGAVYIVNSKTGVLLAELHGTAEGEAFGTVLSELPDQNGDGKTEFLVSAPFADYGIEDGGRVNLFSSVDYGSQAAYFGIQTGEQLGAAISWIDDQDGDGLAELMLGAPGYDATLAGSSEGALYVYSTLKSAPLYTLTGPATGSGFGAALLGLDDLDFDGVHDVAVGLPNFLGGRGAMRVLSMATGTVLHQILGDQDTDHFGATLAHAGQADGFGQDDFAAGTSGTGNGYVHLVGLPSFSDIGFVDVVDEGTGFGSSIAFIGDVNSDSLDDLAIGAPFEVVSGQQESGVVRISTLAKGPVVLSVDGVHSTLAGELVLHGANLLAGTKVFVDGQEVPGITVSVGELRVPVGIDEPGGFKSLEVSSTLGTNPFPGGLARYPALECDANLPLGDNLEVRLANGEPGVYVLGFSSQRYATPALFESFGWYYGLELNGLWIAAAGVFTPESTTRNFILPGTDAVYLIGTEFYLQAWTSQSFLGLAGFSNAVTTTIAP